MGGKLKRQLTKEEKRRRGAPLRRHKDRMRSLWLILGAVEVAVVTVIMRLLGV